MDKTINFCDRCNVEITKPMFPFIKFETSVFVTNFLSNISRSATVTVSNLIYYLRRIQDGTSFITRAEEQAVLDRMEENNAI